MKILSWYGRELGNQPTVDILSQLVREKAPKILFLKETKQSMEEMRRLQDDLPYRCMLAIPSIRRCGGLALLWMEDVNLHIQTYTLNHIDALILTNPQTSWRLTGFYGWPEEEINRSHGDYYDTFTQGLQYHGFVVGILMRFCHLKRSRVVYLGHFDQCKRLERLCYPVVWWTWVSKVTFLSGIMVVMV